MTASHDDRSALLRRSLRANGVFSATSGLLFTLAGGPLAGFLGVAPAWLVTVVGLNLLGFAAALFFLASRPAIPPALATTVVALDLGWVLGTIALVYADVFTRGGAAAALLVANVVLVFAVLQGIGVRRLAGPGAAATSGGRAWKIGLGVWVALPAVQLLVERSVTLPIGPSRMLTIAVCAVALAPIGLALLARLAGGPASRPAWWTAAALVPLLAIAHLLAVSRFADGPFGPVPGGPFDAAAATPPADWSAAAGLRYAELEVDPVRPRTLETLVLVDGGALFVAANMPEDKRWPRAVRESGAVRVRLGSDAVYDRTAAYVDSPARTRALLDAMTAKYGFDVSMGGPIWFFRLDPRATSVAAGPADAGSRAPRAPRR